MANSSRYNDHYRDLDLIEGDSRVMTPLLRMEIVYAIAEHVRRQERDFQIMLGADALEAHFEAWDAYQGVLDIHRNPHPQFYCDTTGKMITGKGVS